MRRRRHNRPKPKPVAKLRLRVNEQILASEVRVIGENGENHGVLSLPDAIKLAQEQESDLVEVSPLANPPVCKITDYGKLQYQEAKQEQQKKAKQKKVDTKGIRLGFRTDKHDLFFKKNQAEKFLMKGHKVRVDLWLRGREKAMLDKAKENLVEFLATIQIPIKYEEEVKKSPRGFTALIVAE
jgi:translation initiation factor IF-3